MFVSVDLPMPGEPPSSTSEPGTRPPPSTRSSSPMPVFMRSTGAAPTSARRRGASAGPKPPPPSPPPPPGPRTPPEPPIPRAALRPPAARPPAGRSVSSISVFQAPQEGHWPCHLASCAPQSEQTWTVVRGTGPGYAPGGTAPIYRRSTDTALYLYLLLGYLQFLVDICS